MSSTSKEGLLAVCGTLAGLSTIFVGLRFYARKIQKIPYMVDDWIVIPALISFVGAAICSFISVSKKVLGYSSGDFTLAQTKSMAKESQQLYFAIGVLLNISLGFTKISAVFFYRRLFCTKLHNVGLHWFNIATIVTLVIISCWLVAFVMLDGFSCGIHISALWQGTQAEYCAISIKYLYGLAISDFLLDVWILILPIPPILHLQTSLSRRLSIIGLFMLAFIGLGASIARMVQYCKVEDGGESLADLDLERTDTESFYLSMLEGGMSLVAVNLPSLWFFFTSLMPDKLKHGIRRVVPLSSLSSQRQKSLGSANAAAVNSSVTHLSRKPDSLSSLNSSRPKFAEFSQRNYRRLMFEQQLSSQSDGQKAEAYAMHEMDNKWRQGGKAWLPQGQIHVTVELSREESQKQADEIRHDKLGV